MRKQSILIILVLALSILSGTTALAQALNLVGNADCEGWGAMATLTFPEGVFFADLDYSVVLSDASGGEVTRFDWAGEVSRFEYPEIVKMYDGPWGLTLAGAYAADLVFHFLGDESTLQFEFSCGEVEEEPVVEPCHYTFRYWRKHPEAWPVRELEIAGRMYSQDRLLRLMHRRLRCHPSQSLVRHLVAAKLNVANGTDPSIQDTIEAADLFLSENAGRAHRRRWRSSEARQLRRELVTYNNLPCDRAGLQMGGAQLEVDKTFAEDAVTFSGLKAMYR